MIDWIGVAGVGWLFVIAAVVVVALFRLSAAVRDRRLRGAGSGVFDPLHVHLRHLIHAEDRIGVALTIAAGFCSVIFASMLADRMIRETIHKLVQVLTFH